MSVYRYRSQAELDASLNARATVTDIAPFMTAYASESSKSREALPCRIGVKYGPKPAEQVDVFPAREPDSPIFVFIHGGYWRMLDASDSSFMARTFFAAGAAVVAVNYELAPSASIDEIVRQCRAAIVHVWRNALEMNGDPARIHVCGSSAGGHLTGMVIAGGWHNGFDANGMNIHSASTLSGLFDLEPVRLSNCNEWAKLDEASAARNSPLRHPPAQPIPLIVSYAPNEASEFAIQSEAYMATCESRGCAVEFVPEPGTNHFDLPLKLMDRIAPLTRAILRVMKLG
jgi:arylformamidase